MELLKRRRTFSDNAPNGPPLRVNDQRVILPSIRSHSNSVDSSDSKQSSTNDGIVGGETVELTSERIEQLRCIHNREYIY